MNYPQASEVLQGATLDLKQPISVLPSFRRALLLFVASVSSFIGASLFLASI
jgi:hypothetical protein